MSARDDFDSLAPQLTVKISGKELANDAAADVISVIVLEDVEAASMFALTVAAWDPTLMKPRWIDDPLFDEGSPVEVLLGYRDDVKAVFSGEITGLEPDFPEGGAPRLVVRGHDRRHRLMRGCRTRSFTQCKDSDIASELASAAGLFPDVKDSEVVLPYVLQHNQTDLEFLAMRARRIGFEVWVRDKNLLFRPRDSASEPVLTLQREYDLLSFRPRLTTLGQVTELEVRGWDPSQKKEIVGHGRAGDEGAAMPGGSNPGTGPANTKRAFDDVPSARVTSPVQTQDEADAMARRGFAEMALRFVRAEGVTLGQPRLRAGIVVKIDGVGDRFGGSYYVTAVEHDFNQRGGYRTRFSARRNARS